MGTNSIYKFGPRGDGDEAPENPCAACGLEFVVGDYSALVPLGPGASKEGRENARTGQPYIAVCVMVHWACATGEIE